MSISHISTLMFAILLTSMIFLPMIPWFITWYQSNTLERKMMLSLSIQTWMKMMNLLIQLPLLRFWKLHHLTIASFLAGLILQSFQFQIIQSYKNLMESPSRSVRFFVFSLNLIQRRRWWWLWVYRFIRGEETEGWICSEESQLHWFWWDCGALFTVSLHWGLSPRGCSSESRMSNSFLPSTIRFGFSSYMTSLSSNLIPTEELLQACGSLFSLFFDTIPSSYGG